MLLQLTKINDMGEDVKVWVNLSQVSSITEEFWEDGSRKWSRIVTPAENIWVKESASVIMEFMSSNPAPKNPHTVHKTTFSNEPVNEWESGQLFDG